jgi:hypothetical protein
MVAANNNLHNPLPPKLYDGKTKITQTSAHGWASRGRWLLRTKGKAALSFWYFFFATKKKDGKATPT